MDLRFWGLPLKITMETDGDHFSNSLTQLASVLKKRTFLD
jgi:hypothetical protein